MSSAHTRPHPVQPHVIKRYANRKLYDPRQSRYITLDEIAELIDAGEEVRIIDNKTKEDITRVTLAQVLVEREKQRNRDGGPLPALRGLIRNTGEQISRRISEPVNTLRSSVEESVERTREQLQGWVEPKKAELEGFQRWLDERVKQTVGRLDVVAQLRGQIDGLRGRIEAIEAALGLRSSGPAAGEAGGREASGREVGGREVGRDPGARESSEAIKDPSGR
jgi:polyhydroxyalkanoate synthesis repressor PhaR